MPNDRAELERRNAQLEALLLQVTTAAHFEQTSEDYFLPDAVAELYVNASLVRKLLTAHPELQSELEALARE